MNFDALKYLDELKVSGVPEKQAKVQVRFLQNVIESDLATKRDLKELEQATKRDIKEIEQNIKRDLKELEQRLTIKLGSILIIALTALVALSRLNLI